MTPGLHISSGASCGQGQPPESHLRPHLCLRAETEDLGSGTDLSWDLETGLVPYRARLSEGQGWCVSVHASQCVESNHR